jgi:hypothetical protein
MATRLVSFGKYHERRGNRWFVNCLARQLVYRRNSRFIECFGDGWKGKRRKCIHYDKRSGHWWHYC